MKTTPLGLSLCLSLLAIAWAPTVPAQTAPLVAAAAAEAQARVIVRFKARGGQRAGQGHVGVHEPQRGHGCGPDPAPPA